jgi:hypothetical protein
MGVSGAPPQPAELVVPAVRGRGEGSTSTSVGFARRKAEVRSVVVELRMLFESLKTRRISICDARRL